MANCSRSLLSQSTGLQGSLCPKGLRTPGASACSTATGRPRLWDVPGPTNEGQLSLPSNDGVVSSVDDAGELVGALHAPARLARDQQATVTHVGPLNGFHGSARTWRCDYHIHAMRHVVKQRSGVPRRHGTRRPKCRTPYTRQEAIARQARWSSQ